MRLSLFEKKEVEVDFLFFAFYGKIVVYRIECLEKAKRMRSKKQNWSKNKVGVKTKLEKK